MSNPVPDPSASELIIALERGDPEAGPTLQATLFHELRGLARGQLSRLAPGQTLQPTALVNEVYLRLAGGGRSDWPDWKHRREFLSVAARAMHDVLVEEARRKASLKRGGAWRRTELAGLELATEAPPEELLALDEALEKLTREDPRKAEIVRLRFFMGLTEEETAHALDVSVRTVRRDWRFVRSWIYSELAEPPDDGSEAAFPAHEPDEGRDS